MFPHLAMAHIQVVIGLPLGLLFLILYGAVIGAGSVVTKNVPPFAVVAGNPAQILRYRFPKEIIKELIASQWWEKSIEEIKPGIYEFQHPFKKIYMDRK